MSAKTRKEIITRLVKRHRKKMAQSVKVYEEMTGEKAPPVMPELEEFEAIFVAMTTLLGPQGQPFYSAIMRNVNIVFREEPENYLKQLKALKPPKVTEENRKAARDAMNTQAEKDTAEKLKEENAEDSE